MTDSRLPDHWLLNTTLDSLSHGAWRLLTRALMFCNQQGTDGAIERLNMRYIFPYGEADEFVAELVAIGWLVETEAGYRIPDWEGKGQSTAAQVSAYRENARQRQQKSREKRKTSQALSVTDDITRDIGQERTGQERTGEANTQGASWPVRQPGSLAG